jgi:hypothetical protein
MRTAALAAVLALAACDDGGPPPLADCGSGSLTGVWHVAEAPLVFHAIPSRGTYELLPIVDDGHVDGALVVAPGAIELTRGEGAGTGEYARRYEQGGAICVVKTPVRLHTCEGQTIHLDVSPPQPPADFTTCTAPPAPVVTWTLTRSR